MRRRLLSLAAAALFTAGSPGAAAELAPDTPTEEECRDYCGQKAAQRCDDVSSTWCNVYILGCLAGCGASRC